MPRIESFKGLRPAKDKLSQVIVKPFDSFYTNEARKILESNPYSFLHTIEPLVENPYQRGSREEIIFKKAKEYFDEFQEEGILIQDEKPAIYIYRTLNKGHLQTGIWVCTALDDYLDNTLKKHEYTRADREKDLIEYLQNTGIDSNPVLVTYEPREEINAIIHDTVKHTPEFEFEADNQKHFLWKLENPLIIEKLVYYFKQLPCSYIADGHHRAAAASMAGIERRKNNLRHTGLEEYNFFSTLYFSFDQLLVYEFQRLVKDLNGFTASDFLIKLSGDFDVLPSSISKPEKRHHITMYLEGAWYLLQAKSHTYQEKDAVNSLDVSILQNYILQPLLGIKDPRTDQRIQFVGGVVPIEDVCNRVDADEMKVVFFLYPTSIEELVQVADSGNVMPPKSTWFEPKLHCGLVTHKVH